MHSFFSVSHTIFFIKKLVPFVAALLVVNCSRTVSYTLSFLIDYIRLLRPLYCICLLEIPNSVLWYALKTYILKMRKLYITSAIMRLSRLLLVFHYHSRMFNIIVWYNLYEFLLTFSGCSIVCFFDMSILIISTIHDLYFTLTFTDYSRHRQCTYFTTHTSDTTHTSLITLHNNYTLVFNLSKPTLYTFMNEILMTSPFSLIDIYI